MRKTVLPLPSACVHCGVTIKARFVREGRSAEFVWVHDAPLGVNIAKGGPHAAEPDPEYRPRRFRVIEGGLAVARQPVYAGRMVA